MTLDPATEFKKKDDLEKEQAAAHQGMEDLIRSSEARYLSLEYNGKKIRIRPALPGKARKEILKFATKYKNVDVKALNRGDVEAIAKLPDGFADESMENLYQSLAALCVDAPYNDPENWRYYDDLTGEVRDVYELAQALIEEAHKKTVSFRTESSGAGPA